MPQAADAAAVADLIAPNTQGSYDNIRLAEPFMLLH